MNLINQLEGQLSQQSKVLSCLQNECVCMCTVRKGDEPLTDLLIANYDPLSITLCAN